MTKREWGEPLEWGRNIEEWTDEELLDHYLDYEDEVTGRPPAQAPDKAAASEMLLEEFRRRGLDIPGSTGTSVEEDPDEREPT